MARFARVESGIVREIIEVEELPPFSPTVAAQFREVGPDVQEGWQEVEGELTAPAPIEEPTDPVKAIKDLVAAMDPVVLMRYAGETSLIGQFLNEANLPGAVGLLTVLASKIEQANDTEAQAALAPVLGVLNG